MPWYDAGGGVVGAWPVLWLLLVAAVLVVGAYLVVRNARTRETAPGDSALAILGRRYASGEIDTEEFEERASRLAERPDG